MTRDRLTYLVNRFLENTATEEELKEYSDWYEQATAKGPDMPDAQTDHLYARILQGITGKKRKTRISRRIYFVGWATAASLVLIAGAYLLFNDTQPTKQLVDIKTEKSAPATHFGNSDSIKRTIRLQDSSIVELYPNSKLDCAFGNNSRELHLTGKAFFEVTKDSSKPFTVYSGQISTTALGTSFTISAFSDSNDIEVRLHTGKVVIKQAQQKINDVYLRAGHSLIYNKMTGIAKTSSLKAPAVNDYNKRPSFGGRTGYEASFNQAPLTDVLDAMKKEYGVSILYKKEALSDMYYSGNILKTDSLARVLKRIALLHNLRIKATANGYSIRKEH